MVVILNRFSIFILGCENKTAYQHRGKDPQRISMALKKPCCKSNCKKKLSLKMVTAMCVAFWSVSKTAQDSMLLVLIVSLSC